MSILKVNNLKAKVEDKEILKGINLDVKKGEVHLIMGPNGAGKSTLGNVLAGHPKYDVLSGEINLDGVEMTDMKADERAKEGLFLSFQYPEEIPGLSVEDFLRSAKSSVSGKRQSIMRFRKELHKIMENLHIDKSYGNRALNVGFSGGEKKKNEILQMAVLNPKVTILDETDSGLDVDAVKIVYEGVEKLKTEDNAIIVITHYDKVLNYLKPDHVHILFDGKIVKSGGLELAHEIEKNGYANIKKEFRG